MNTLVTGGSGYLGTHVRRFFDAQDFSRRSGANILDPEDVKRVADYNVVIHLAAHLDKDPAGEQETFHTNVEGTANVLRNLQPNSVFIFASTKDVYGAHAGKFDEVPETCPTDYCGQSALEWSKLMAEKYVEYYARTHNIRACIFRLSTVYARQSEGNESGFVTHYVESVKRGWPIRLPVFGNPVRDILHVDDFSRACRAFIDSEHTFGLYNLGGGRTNAASLLQIAQKIGKLIELDPVIQNDEYMPHPVPLHYVSDIRRVRDQLGWEPEIGMEEGLRSVL
jgi:nucleoside-diphosphate-sugar epimerase